MEKRRGSIKENTSVNARAFSITDHCYSLKVIIRFLRWSFPVYLHETVSDEVPPEVHIGIGDHIEGLAKYETQRDRAPSMRDSELHVPTLTCIVEMVGISRRHTAR